MRFCQIITIQLMICLAFSSYGQVEHNFVMTPEKTDCHSLIMKEDSAINIQEIRKSTFRFKEEIKISRYYTPRSIEYYSCDGENGYLIAIESEDHTILFVNVPKTKYDSLSNSDDPITFYKQYFKTN
jgi:hypothetical protein